MAQKILIFAPLAVRLGGLQPLLQERHVEVVLFGSWSDLSKHIHDPELIVIVLGVGVGSLNGMDCCRQIKQRQAFKAIRIFLIAADKMADSKENALATGCDLFSTESEAEQALRSELVELLGAAEKPVARAALRFHFSGPLFCIEGEEAEVGEILNASRTGVLFASPRATEIGQEVLLRFQSSQGKEADIKAIVKRTISLPPKFSENQFGIGAEFIDLDASQSDALDWLLAYREQRIPTWSSTAISEILSADWKKVVQMLREDVTRALLDGFIGDLKDYEQKALEEETTGKDLLLELLALRLQCAVFTTFVPEMRRAQESLEAVLLKPIQSLLNRLKDLEEKAERSIQENSEITVPNQHHLIEASDRLHAEKLKLLFTIDESISMDGVSGSGAETLATIRQKVAYVRNLQRTKEAN